jgi:hypothetical protein
MFHAEITISVCNLADYIMYTAHMFVDEIPSVLPEKKRFLIQSFILCIYLNPNFPHV